MVTIITTPGAADANSYVTVSGAASYHAARLYSDLWNDADPDDQAAALVMAAKFLDAMPGAWTGTATSSGQVLGWPRIGMLNRNGFPIASGEIPTALKDAQSEFARQLLGSDLTETNAIVAQGINSLSAGPVSLSFQQSQKEYLALRQKDAQNAIIPDAVRMLLVPSWLGDPRDEEAKYSGLIAEVL